MAELSNSLLQRLSPIDVPIQWKEQSNSRLPMSTGMLPFGALCLGVDFKGAENLEISRITSFFAGHPAVRQSHYLIESRSS